MASASAAGQIVGILLAAGRGTRFGGDKLLAHLDGERVGVASCRHLLEVLPRVAAIVRPEDNALAAALGAAGARIVRCPNADAGMGASLACGVKAAQDASGWIIALADMPWVLSATIERVAARLAAGAIIAAPYFQGTRGHPIGFSAVCFDALAALDGDEGAKAVVEARRDVVVRIDIDDPGVLRDVDTPADLAGGVAP